MMDEKLIECSAEAMGVYIRLLCIMHKSEGYGKILLKPKDKQNASKGSSKIKLFAFKLLKYMPYEYDVIERSLQELVNKKVLHIEGDYLIQKRMVRDNELSKKRAKADAKDKIKIQFKNIGVN